MVEKIRSRTDFEGSVAANLFAQYIVCIKQIGILGFWSFKSLARTIGILLPG